MEPFLLIYLLSLLFYILFSLYKLISHNQKHCYMLDYVFYKPTDDRKLDTRSCAKIVVRNKNLGLEEYRFLVQTMVSSGIGEETYGPRNVIAGKEESPSIRDALSELDDIIFGTLDELFSRSKVPPSKIDILVVNVSLLSPAPSLTSRIVNWYKMREDVKSFNLSGMGCSASLVAIDLVHHLFKNYSKPVFGVVVSTESLGSNWYTGKEKSMMLSNCLFRSGGCSMLLTNDKTLENQAKFQLTHLARTHLGSNDEAYGCCIQVEDDLGHPGFLLTRNLTKAAAKALTMNLGVLVPKILPITELIHYKFSSYRRKKQIKNSNLEMVGAGLNLKTGVEHFCIHPGGRAVIDGVGRSLKLTAYDMEPARMALHRFGNTSAGGLWYVLGYMEAKNRLKKGDRILMISLGAGFKCNNCVWEVKKDLELDDGNVWKDSISGYPPEKMANPFVERFSWINDEHLSFLRLDQIQAAMSTL